MTEQSINRIYDYRVLAQITNGNKEFEKKLINIFVTTVPISIQKLRISLEDNDYISLAETAHKLKTTVHTMGIITLAEPLKKLEEFAKKKENLGEVEELTKQVATFMESLTLEFKSRQY